MNAIKYISTLKLIRVTGVLMLCSFVLPIINWGLILSLFVSSEANVCTKIIEQQQLFRINIMNQIVSSIIVLILGFLLYQLLKSVNQAISLFALLIKVFESLLNTIFALLYLVTLSLVNSGYNQEGIIRGSVENYIHFTSIPGIFFGSNMLIFSFLFYKSGIIPKWLAVFGMFSNTLVILYDISAILFPTYSQYLLVQVIGSAPVCVFQPLASIWLILKK